MVSLKANLGKYLCKKRAYGVEVSERQKGMVRTVNWKEKRALAGCKTEDLTRKMAVRFVTGRVAVKFATGWAVIPLKRIDEFQHFSDRSSKIYVWIVFA